MIDTHTHVDIQKFNRGNITRPGKTSIIRVVPDYFSFVDKMLRAELLSTFWTTMGNGSFVDHMINFLDSTDLGKIVTESEEYLEWKEEQKNKPGKPGGGGQQGGG